MKNSKWMAFIVIAAAVSLFSPTQALSNDPDSLVVTETGNVGIGTTIPTNPLEILSPNNSQIKLLKTYSGDTTFGVLAWDDCVYLSAGIYFDENQWFHQSSNSHNQLIRMRPGNGVTWYASNNGTCSWNVSGGELLWKDTGEWANGVHSTVNGSSYFTGGNVGIGTTNPGAKLDINTTNPTAGGWYEAIRFSQPSHAAITHPGGGLLFGMHGNRNFYFADILGGTFQKYILILNAISGGVGVGMAPQYPLDVNGTARAVAFTTSSDLRLKEDVAPIGNALGQITQLRAVKYRLKNLPQRTSEDALSEEFSGEALPDDVIAGQISDPQTAESPREQIGLIAQEVEQIFPEVVYTDEDGYKSIAYGQLVAPLIEAVKELNKENAQLKKEIQAITARLDAIEGKKVRQ